MNRINYLIISLIILFTQCSGLEHMGKFEIGENTFKLNDEDFSIHSAELHYSRIPREYWDHRIKMCKSMGMNTITTYIFWNYHELTEGNFDFSGNKDIAEFCRIAQDNGMYVIIKPGPYVCSEWDMGGLPWWLLKNDSIKLRSLDPKFMNPVKRYLKEVGNQLSDLQITRGGNIIMAQVENEFSYYDTNKPYIDTLKNIFKQVGFNEIPLFQCDWMSNFQNNGLNDLLWSMNFGIGCDILSQFRKVKELRPTYPLMCSEFWSGWFDKWGYNHETRSANVMIHGINLMIDNNISFNLYMAHGGTSFGVYAGANDNPYSPLCTGYDYDAPITEDGKTTEKFFLIKNRLDKNDLPIPEENKMIEIPKIELIESYPLYMNLPEPIYSEDIHPMEYFDLGYGSIMYRKIIESNLGESLLELDDVHDYGIVFLNKTRIIDIDRRKSTRSVKLKLNKGDTLDIYVEATGRINFGKNLIDRKGITNSVKINNKDIHGWYVYKFPLDNDFIQSLKFGDQSPSGINYYKAYFSLSELGDTYLDLSNFGKGFVWINGIPLGRFWNIGPQYTLYVPKPFLSEYNEVTILDILGEPIKPVIKGVKNPEYVNKSLKVDLNEDDVTEVINLLCIDTDRIIEFGEPLSGRYLGFDINSIDFCLVTDDREFIYSRELNVIFNNDRFIAYDLGRQVSVKSIIFSKTMQEPKLNMYLKDDNFIKLTNEY